MEKDTKLTFALAAFLLFLGVIFYVLDDTGKPTEPSAAAVLNIEPAAGEEVMITIGNDDFFDVKKDINAEMGEQETVFPE